MPAPQATLMKMIVEGIMAGGVVRLFMDSRKKVDEKTKERQATDGTLYCAGMIAGEGLVGILHAILADLQREKV